MKCPPCKHLLAGLARLLGWTFEECACVIGCFNVFLSSYRSWRDEISHITARKKTTLLACYPAIYTAPNGDTCAHCVLIFCRIFQGKCIETGIRRLRIKNIYSFNLSILGYLQDFKLPPKKHCYAADHYGFSSNTFCAAWIKNYWPELHGYTSRLQKAVWPRVQEIWTQNCEFCNKITQIEVCSSTHQWLGENIF